MDPARLVRSTNQPGPAADAKRDEQTQSRAFELLLEQPGLPASDARRQAAQDVATGVGTPETVRPRRTPETTIKTDPVSRPVLEPRPNSSVSGDSNDRPSADPVAIEAPRLAVPLVITPADRTNWIGGEIDRAGSHGKK